MKKTAKPDRVYVKVSADFDTTGYMQPRAVIWWDGRIFPVEKVTDFCPAGIRGDGRSGDCFTVMIQGQERYLFFERTDPRFSGRFGRWFVEAAGTGEGL